MGEKIITDAGGGTMTVNVPAEEQPALPDMPEPAADELGPADLTRALIEAHLAGASVSQLAAALAGVCTEIADPWSDDPAIAAAGSRLVVIAAELHKIAEDAAAETRPVDLGHRDEATGLMSGPVVFPDDEGRAESSGGADSGA